MKKPEKHDPFGLEKKVSDTRYSRKDILIMLGYCAICMTTLSADLVAFMRLFFPNHERYSQIPLDILIPLIPANILLYYFTKELVKYGRRDEL